MSFWTRATALTFCEGPHGGTGQEIYTGDPVYIIVIPGVSRRSPRCRRCAHATFEVEPPADLPPLGTPDPSRLEFLKPMLKLPAGRGALPFDWKQAQTGREPGEDDD